MSSVLHLVSLRNIPPSVYQESQRESASERAREWRERGSQGGREGEREGGREGGRESKGAQETCRATTWCREMKCPLLLLLLSQC
jgi:hypothetical protein